jgi:hypothetical protein
VEKKIHLAGAVELDPALKSRIRGLIAARVAIAGLGPALLLPVGNLAALDYDLGGVPPHHPLE